jgi:hypothetical protein
MRLPTKETTKHVPKHRQPEGAVNAHGELKTIDKQTGHAKWIDMKKPVVLDNEGNPTHRIQ